MSLSENILLAFKKTFFVGKWKIHSSVGNTYDVVYHFLRANAVVELVRATPMGVVKNGVPNAILQN